MILRNALRLSALALALAGALVSGVSAANAQGFGGQMPPEIAKKIKAWQKFGEDHKKLMTLGDQVFQIGEMNKSPEHAVNKDQAKKLLAVINGNKAKTSLSEDEAGALLKQISGVLTPKQIKKMTTIETPRQRMQKARAGGGGGAGGGGAARPGGGAGGGFSFPDPPAKGWNPLNPDSLPFEQMRPRAKESMNQFVADLKNRAK